MNTDHHRTRLIQFTTLAIATLLTVLPCSSYASADKLGDTCDESTLANRWIRSIESQDWSGMSALLAPEASYSDPTMVHFGGDAVRLKGRDNIVEFWRASSDDSESQQIRYEFVRCFETGGVTVLTLELSISVGGAYWGVSTDRIDLTGHQTTVISANDTFITSVIDYVDYADAERQVERYRGKYGPVRDSKDNQ